MNLANKLTLLRIAMIPLFVATFYLPWAHRYWLSAILFILAFITDSVDGYIARSRNMVTNFGKLMDPIADKLLSMSAMIMLTWTGQLSPIISIIILSREFIVNGLRLVAANNGKIIAAAWLGKAKTVSQFVMLLFIILTPFWRGIWGVSMTNIMTRTITGISVILTIWSGFNYIKVNKQFINFKK